MLTIEMARCIAKISGDGNLYYRYIRYSNTCDTLREEFKEDCKKEFGNINFTEGIGNSGTKFVQIHGKKNIARFLEYLPDYRSEYIFVPNQIKQANKNIKRNYLRAFYDDEGSPSLRLNKKTKEWKRSISLASNSLQILQEIKEILIKYPIKTNKIVRSKPESNYDKTFVLNITGKENFLLFKENIGFKHPSKIKRLDFIIRSYNCTYSRNRSNFNNLLRDLARHKP